MGIIKDLLLIGVGAAAACDGNTLTLSVIRGLLE